MLTYPRKVVSTYLTSRSMVSHTSESDNVGFSRKLGSQLSVSHIKLSTVQRYSDSIGVSSSLEEKESCLLLVGQCDC